MSVRVMAWVWEHSRAEPTDRLVLLAIADAANDHGAEAYPSMATLTKKTRLAERSVQRAIKRLSDLGELVVKPNAGPRGTNRYRITMTPGAESPPPQSHPRPKDTPSGGRGATESPDPRHSDTGTPVTVTPEPSSTHPEPSEEPSSSEPASRPDVEAICLHLADWIERNGSKRPTITKAWRDAARLMLDRDDRTAEQVMRAIDWCQQDEFWRANVLSMPTLRKQYDRLRLAAQRGSPGAKPSTVDNRVVAALDAGRAAAEVLNQRRREIGQ